MIKELYLELLDKCLLKCKHCSTSATVMGKKRISYDVARKVIREAKEMGAERLTLSGGEPLLYDRIWDLLIYSKEIDLHTTVYTSGVIETSGACSSIDEYTSRRLSGLVDRIITSVHHSNSITHDTITGIEGSYHLTIESIKTLVKFNSVEAHMVPMKNNYTDIPNVVNLCSDLGVERISFLRLVPQGRCKDNPYLIMTTEDYLQLRDIFVSLSGTNNRIRIGAPYKCLFLNNAGRCSAGENKVLISPDGSVLPCEAFKSFKSVYNINEHSLRFIWVNDPRLNEIRKLKNIKVIHCEGCPHYASCLGGCPGQREIAYGNVAFGPDPACIYHKETL